MKNEFIPYEQTLELKKLGFDELCMAGYDKDFIGKLYIGFSTDDGALFNTEYYILAPLYQQAFRWFREKYQLNGLLNHYPNTKKWDCSVHNLNWSGKELMEYIKTEDRVVKYSTYEEAELACLKKLIEIAKNKQNYA